MVDKIKKVGAFFTMLTSVLSLLATIVYITWFQASLDKRVSLLEQAQGEIIYRLSDMKTNQEQNMTRNETEIDLIYQILLNHKKGN